MSSYPGAVVALAVCEAAIGPIVKRDYILTVDGDAQSLPLTARSLGEAFDIGRRIYPHNDISVREA